MAPGARPSPCLLAQNPQHRVRLWSAREENGRLLQERRENVRLLPGVPIPDSVELTTRRRSKPSADADLWVAAIPTVYLRATLERDRAAGASGAAGAESGQRRGKSARSCGRARS